MTYSTDDLYELLPSVYRIRDAEQGQVLKALISVLAAQAQVVEQDIALLYENWFIETCEPWVVPYIGDLLGVRGLNSVSQATFSLRARVANTLGYRRRKGTAAMLEQLAHDTTGWPAHAVEFFELLGTTQNYNHLRLFNLITPDLRRTDLLELLNTPFDQIAHTVDVRHISSGRGKHNIPNIGLFLWRLQDYPLAGVNARSVASPSDGRFTFNPLGIDAPLFNSPQPEIEITHLAEEINVPGPLRRRPLYDELEARRQAIVDLRATWQLSQASLDSLSNDGVPGVTVAKLGPLLDQVFPSEQNFVTALNPLLTPAERSQFKSAVVGRALRLSNTVYFGAQPVFEVFVQASAGAPFVRVPPEEIMICYLDKVQPPVPEVWLRPAATKNYIPSAGGPPKPRVITMGVDPVRGRIAFPQGVLPTAVRVDFAYGFSGDMGGGPYDRSNAIRALKTLDGEEAFLDKVQWRVGVSQTLPTVAHTIFSTLADAVDEWNKQLPNTVGAIAVLDSRTYVENLVGAHHIQIPAGSQLLIYCADLPTGLPLELAVPQNQRAHVQGNISVEGTASSTAIPGELILNGLLIEGDLKVLSGNLGSLRISHCTTAPASGDLSVNGTSGANDELILSIESSICGMVDLQTSAAPLQITDSIIDGHGNPTIVQAPDSRADLETSTFLGAVNVKQLEASNSIFADPATAHLRQAGCVRFCYLADGSMTPRRYRCQPDLALVGVDDVSMQNEIKLRLEPSFTSKIYGDPGYAQLKLTVPMEIRGGADDAAEMGAFHFLQQPQREANLRASLDEYLRFSLEAGIFYAT